MEILVRQEDNVAVVRVKGRIVRENKDELRNKLEEVISKGVKGIALDFEEVNYVDSAGLGCCAAAQKLMQERGSGSLVMFGAPPNVEKAWKFIFLHLVIPLFQKEKEALARLTQEGP